jgi:GNAT superfamily N-acetyltransferase
MPLSTLPPGFTLRRPTLDDVPIVAELIKIRDETYFGFRRATEENLRHGWSMPGEDLEHDAWLIFAPEGQLVGLINIGKFSMPMLYATAVVHPDYAHLGLDAYLLELAEARARELIEQAPAGARVALNTFNTDNNQTYLQTIEQAGFAYVRSQWRMQIDMTEPPPVPVWPEGIILRPFTLDMAHAVYEADDEAFKDHWGHVTMPFELFEHWFIKTPEFDPTLWFVPMEGEQIAGCTLCYLDEQGFGWCGGLSILRPWRRKGIALAMLQHAFGEFYRRGIHRVALDVDAASLTGATRLYEKAGMHIVYQENQYQKELRPGVEMTTQMLEE